MHSNMSNSTTLWLWIPAGSTLQRFSWWKSDPTCLNSRGNKDIPQVKLSAFCPACRKGLVLITNVGILLDFLGAFLCSGMRLPMSYIWRAHRNGQFEYSITFSLFALYSLTCRLLTFRVANNDFCSVSSCSVIIPLSLTVWSVVWLHHPIRTSTICLVFQYTKALQFWTLSHQFYSRRQIKLLTSKMFSYYYFSILAAILGLATAQESGWQANQVNATMCQWVEPRGKKVSSSLRA